MINFIQNKSKFSYSQQIFRKENKQTVSVNTLNAQKKWGIPKGISFGSKSPSRETMHYLEQIKNKYRSLHFELFDLDKIHDVCDGIDVFKGFSSKDFKTFIENLSTIELQRGCVHQCSHCGAEAPKRIQTMKYDNLAKLVDGLAEMKKRIGFNFLKQDVVLFNSSDPMIYSSVDNKGTPRNFYDAAALWHSKLKKKSHITTAGWHSTISQDAAEKIVKNPEIVSNMNISVGTFHDFMTRSLQAKEKKNASQAIYWRNKYINMMANVFKTIDGSKIKASVILNMHEPLHFYNFADFLRCPKKGKFSRKNNGFQASMDLIKDIMVNLNKKGGDIAYWVDKDFNCKQTIHSRNIGLFGKASRSYKPVEKSVETITMQKAQEEPRYLFIAPDGKIWRSIYENNFGPEVVQASGNVYLEKSLNFD